MFTLGMGFLLATVAVFLRDMFYIYGIVLTLWTYLTPIMYDISIITNPILHFCLKLNPMYQYINFARTIILYHHTPTGFQFIVCGLSALVVLIVGIIVFKKNQNKFIYYI